MERISIEVCMISAQGLPRSPFLWKHHWFAVGWIDPHHKYCSKIDFSGGSNPTWRTKFSASVDGGAEALTVEVRRRDAVFLRDRLHGSVSIPLKELLVKFAGGRTLVKSMEEVGSFQLRRRTSGEPCGFVDLSLRIAGGRTEDNSCSSEEQPKVGDGVEGSNTRTSFYPLYHPSMDSYEQKTSPQSSPPPPPPPPSNVGFIPSFFPTSERLLGTYMNLPSARTPGRNTTHARASAGALAAGALIFGDDFMSNSSMLPTSFEGGGDQGMRVSIDPPF